MSETVVDTSKEYISGVTDQCKCIDTDHYESVLKMKININHIISLIENVLLLLFIINRYRLNTDEGIGNKLKYYIPMLFIISLIILNILTFYFNNRHCNDECKVKNKDEELTITGLIGCKILPYIILLWYFKKCDNTCESSV
jgi:Na+/H+ antiporter NhaC